jgi:long-chain acyl-CoA synthetase
MTELSLRPGYHAGNTPQKPAIIEAATGQVTTFEELEEQSTAIACLFDSLGLRPGDHIAIVMHNCAAYLAVTWAAQRAGLFFTPINWHLTADEAAYILDDCGATVLFASARVRELAETIIAQRERPLHCYSVSETFGAFTSLAEALGTITNAPRSSETEGAFMFYSSGTTGRPKGILRALTSIPFGTGTSFDALTGGLFGFVEPMVYLCPAPLYHAAPLGWSMSANRYGGTVVLMENFDAVEALRCIEQYGITHAQFVPTMFVRMLKLDPTERTRFDLSSLKVAVHAAAPCPVDVKQQMIDWWGPILLEYYAGSEGNGFCFVDSPSWLTHRGTVGRSVMGTVRIVDEEGGLCPTGEVGTVYFEGTAAFEYHNDPEKTASAFDKNGWSTLGDLGHLDDEGFLYLSDRRSHLIISGGVNIYPQEVENVLTMHPKVADVAVIGVPHPEMGEEVKAVVQLANPADATDEVARELMAFCQERLARFKCPRSVDFDPELPRLPTGKLFKRRLIDRYRA